MKDILEFEKLFKVNIPVKQHFEYYMETIRKSAFYIGIGDVAKEFEQYELEVEQKGYSSARSYKLDYALPKLKKYLLNTKAYAKLISDNFHDSKLRTKDELKINDNTYLVSIDFRSANYSVLKTYDDSGELFDSWEELCGALDIHQTLVKSKSFRQFVFGNTSPKRLTKIQHVNIIKIVDELIQNYNFEENDFVFISHDEFIVRLDSGHALAINKIDLLLSSIENIIEDKSINMWIHHKIFKNKSIGSGMSVQTEYQVDNGGLSEKHSMLFKVPGNIFYFYFKKYILECDLDDRDLYFEVDGKLAQWVI